MKLLILLVAFYLERRHYWPGWTLLRDLACQWARYCRDRGESSGQGALWLLAYALPPLSVVGVLLHGLQHHLYGLFYWLLALALALWVWNRSDDAQDDMAEPEEPTPPGSDNAQLQLLSPHLRLEQEFQHRLRSFSRSQLRRDLAPLFWWVLLGPWCMLAYALLALAAEVAAEKPGSWPVIERVQCWLDWPAARLLALSFALVGDFVGCIDMLRQQLLSEMPAEDLLMQASEQALHLEEFHDQDTVDGELWSRRFTAIRALFERCRWLWVAITALLTLYYPPL